MAIEDGFNKNTNTRLYWVYLVQKLCEKPLNLLANDKLKANMPVEMKHNDRINFTYLEMFARVLCGISPFLELHCSGNFTEDPAEEEIAKKLLDLTKEAMRVATDKGSNDYMNFEKGLQPLVDIAFLCQAILRAPNALWHGIEQELRERIKTEFKKARKIKPFYSNWLLFSAMVETFMYFIGEDWDKTKVDLILKTIDQWYKGDGAFGDGPYFKWDYYNSFVIYPMLVDILKIVSKEEEKWEELEIKIIKRAKRYAIILERLISPEGTFAPIGRSITYRTGVFHLLSLLCLYHELPSELSPAQVRCALTKVMKNIFESKDTFDEDGWLRIGLVGHQSSLAEDYISTGSLYLCSTVFLPLGLPSSDEFWSLPDQMWTSQKIWSGLDLEADKAIE